MYQIQPTTFTAAAAQPVTYYQPTQGQDWQQQQQANFKGQTGRGRGAGRGGGGGRGQGSQQKKQPNQGQQQKPTYNLKGVLDYLSKHPEDHKPVLQAVLKAKAQGVEALLYSAGHDVADHLRTRLNNSMSHVASSVSVEQLVKSFPKSYSSLLKSFVAFGVTPKVSGQRRHGYVLLAYELGETHTLKTCFDVVHDLNVPDADWEHSYKTNVLIAAAQGSVLGAAALGLSQPVYEGLTRLCRLNAQILASSENKQISGIRYKPYKHSDESPDDDTAITELLSRLNPDSEEKTDLLSG